MVKSGIAALALVGVMANTAAAQDAKTVISNASQAMGVDGLNSIHYYGVGADRQPRPEQQRQPAVAADGRQRLRPRDRLHAAGVAGHLGHLCRSGDRRRRHAGAGTPQTQQLITPQNTAWAQQLEIWITPWGFLKGAAANDATVRSQTVDGRRYQAVTFNAPVKSPGGQPYRVVGYINGDNMVERVQTWLEHPIFGDMLVEADYLHYRDNNGLKYPARIVQKRAGWPTFEAFILGAHANPGEPAGADDAAAAGGRARWRRRRRRRAGGARGRRRRPRYSEQLAPGVFRIGQKPAAGTYNALADRVRRSHRALRAGPGRTSRAPRRSSPRRSAAIPNKPIRYGVISHHHADHTGGIAAVVAEGITIVTPEVNRAYLMNALSAPRTLAPDALAKSGKKPQIEGFKGDKRVFQDAHAHLRGARRPGAAARGWQRHRLPAEGADPRLRGHVQPAAGRHARCRIRRSSARGCSLDNIERLKLDVDRIISVHGLDPNNDGRLTSVKEIRASLGR